ncbi:MAG: IMP dehydrogenase [Verrucomicrobiota bacterium]
MSAYPWEGLTFDDVSLVPRYADFPPDQANINSVFSRNISLNIPFISAAMDTVTQSRMAIAIALLGGLGVVHKNQTAREQATQISQVKHYLHGLIPNPVVFRDDQTVTEMLEEKEKNNYQFAGFPVLNKDGKLTGILTARDIKFLTDYNVRVSEVMTSELVVGKEGTSTAEAFDIMVQNQVGKLPIVDDDWNLTGLYSFNDVKTITENVEPGYNRDEEHRLRAAGAIGPHDDERIQALVDVEVDALVVDTAHGHSKGVIDTVKQIKKEYPDVDIVAGNVATAEAAKALVEAGADAVKVGIGPGSICTTRVVAGVGVPQLSAVYEVRQAVGEAIPVISDGGIAYSGDVAKALAVGADSVMMGSALAGTEESPGERILQQGRTFVAYRGMGSFDAMVESAGSRERYGQKETRDSQEIVPQGVEGLVPYRGNASEVLHQFVGGLKYALGYCGSKNLRQLRQNARLVRISSAGLHEAHPHDVKVLKDAPNYRS